MNQTAASMTSLRRRGIVPTALLASLPLTYVVAGGLQDPLKPFELARDTTDRRELVTPAESGFKPTVSGPKVELTLFTRDARIRSGESLWFRAEMRNVGSEPIIFQDPFIKSGSGGDGWSKYRLDISPRPYRSSIPGDSTGGNCPESTPPIPGWEAMSEAERKDARLRHVREESVRHKVNIVLQPGETVRTRDWRPYSFTERCAAEAAGKPPPDRPGGLFREHEYHDDFKKPGTYTLKLIYNDPGHQPRPDEIDVLKKLGRSPEQIDSFSRHYLQKPALQAESAPISLEVTRG